MSYNVLKTALEEIAKCKDSVNSKITVLINVTLVITAVTALNEIISQKMFQCPCVKNQTDSNSTGSANTGQFGFRYSLTYIVAPSIIMLAVGFAGDVEFWNNLMEWARPSGRHGYFSCSNILASCWKAFLHAAIAPCAWLSVVMLDGQYYACLSTPLPYKIEDNQDCDNEDELAMTSDYIKNKRFSQLYGWFVITFFVVVGFIGVTCLRCCKSHHHAQRNLDYKKFVKDELEVAITKRVKKEIKEIIREFVRANSTNSWEECDQFMSQWEEELPSFRRP